MFFVMLLCGFICGLVFDFFRAVRRLRRSSSGIVAIQDIVFWVMELTLVYAVAFRLNYARIRVYELVALVMGSWLYFMTVSSWIVNLLCRVIDFVYCLLFRFLHPVAALLRRGSSFARKVCLGIYKRVHPSGSERDKGKKCPEMLKKFFTFIKP